MKKKRNDKKATTSANVMAGTKINLNWLNHMTDVLSKILSAASA